MVDSAGDTSTFYCTLSTQYRIVSYSRTPCRKCDPFCSNPQHSRCPSEIPIKKYLMKVERFSRDDRSTSMMTGGKLSTSNFMPIRLQLRYQGKVRLHFILQWRNRNTCFSTITFITSATPMHLNSNLNLWNSEAIIVPH